MPFEAIREPFRGGREPWLELASHMVSSSHIGS